MDGKKKNKASAQSGVPQRIQEVRRYFNLSQEEFGKNIEVGRDVIANLETGRTSCKKYYLCAIALIYNISYQWLLTGDGQMHGNKRVDDVSEIKRRRL